MSVVVIAEKPSVARDLARVLGATRKAQGYLEGGGYRVTWALGHLVLLAEPDDYGAPWKGRWFAEQLPMLPDPWRLKTAPKTADQFQVVRRLITDPATERLVCATDAGREGELIFRLIYEQAQCTKPFDRLWVSSLTDEAIRAGFRNLKPGGAYDHLARAARSRAQADWLIGMNLTRAYTVHNRVLCTVGRVQTPTLAMIVGRDAEIAAFKATPYYELVAHLQEGFRALYSRDGETSTRLTDKAEAEHLLALLAPHHTGTVEGLERQIRREAPPPLYDLTALQRDANRRLGLTAAQVLELAQTLYETEKLISYPRTESRHIGEDLVPQLPRLLAGLDHPQATAALARLSSGHRLGRAYVDQTRLTDHHAILPTGRSAPAGLGGPLRRLYDLIQTRFVCCFLPDRVVEETRALLAIGGCDFLARGSRELDPGWRIADPPPRHKAAGAQGPSARVPSNGSDDELALGAEQVLPPLEQGQQVGLERLELREGETSPPQPYTDATLLAAMKNAGRTLDDKDLARAMRATGLGTPATRAEILEKLIRTGYVERQRKQLRSTEKGRALIAVVAPPLKAPALTAQWEQRLKEVEEGLSPVEAFDQGIRVLVRALIPKVWEGPAFTPAQAAAAGEGAGARHQGGPRSKGTRRTQRRPDAQGQRPARASSGADQGAAGGGPVGLPCPKCGRGLIIQGRRGFGCDRFRDGCDFVVWREVAGKRLTERQIAELIQWGRTSPIQGLRDPSGETFAGCLELGPESQTLVRRSDR